MQNCCVAVACKAVSIFFSKCC